MNKEHEIEFRSKKINFFDGLEYNIQFQISTFNKKFRIKIELYVELFYFSKVLFVRLLGFDLWNYFWRSKSIHENLIHFQDSQFNIILIFHDPYDQRETWIFAGGWTSKMKT